MNFAHSRRHGFTLVEILIVVVILGILAALVIPNFTRATMESTKAALSRELQTISHQIEIYRTRNAGGFPTNDLNNPLVEGGANSGWGVLVSENYLRDAPMNPYTASSLIVEGTEDSAMAHPSSDGSAGWYFEQLPNQLNIFAAGFDKTHNRLSHEPPVTDESEEPTP